MIAFSEVLLPAFAGVLLYATAWALWRCLLSPSRPCEMQAEQRAKLLLGEFLTDEESRQLSERGHLLVRSPHRSDRIYRIQGEGRWIDIYDSGKLSMRVSAKQREHIPAGDAVLMHKFMIEGSEDEYLRSTEVEWRRAAGGEEFGWRRASDSNDRRNANMLAKMEGGTTAKGGVYWSVKDGEFITVPKEGGLLEKGSGRSYIKVPLPIVLVVGPIMGILFAFFLPLSGLLVLGSMVKQKLTGAVSTGAAGMASPRMQPGVSYLEPTSQSAEAEAAAPSAGDDGKLIELAKEIAERRWTEGKK